MVREYVIEHLADDDAVLVVDETGFLKQAPVLACGSTVSSSVTRGWWACALNEARLPDRLHEAADFDIEEQLIVLRDWARMHRVYPNRIKTLQGLPQVRIPVILNGRSS